MSNVKGTLVVGRYFATADFHQQCKNLETSSGLFIPLSLLYRNIWSCSSKREDIYTVKSHTSKWGTAYGGSMCGRVLQGSEVNMSLYK